MGFFQDLFCGRLQRENEELKSKVATLEELNQKLKTENKQLQDEIQNYQEFITDIKQSDVL